MKKIILLAIVSLLTACTHYTISDASLLKDNPPYTKKELQQHPLNIDADTTCYSTTNGNRVTTRCSNKSRIENTVSIFKERGLYAVPAKDEKSAPKIVIKEKSINKAFETTTGIFNILTLGLSPLYHYDTYTVAYIDPENSVEVEKSVRVSSYSGWFSLFMSNPDGLGKIELKNRAEKNLIRTVLDEANVGTTITQ